MANPVTRIIITAVDQASSVFDKIRSKASVLSAALVGYFGARLFGGIVDQAAEFEEAMSRVQAASQASADEMILLRAAAEEAGATTKYTATEAAGALEEITKAGVDAAGAVAALPAVLNLASAGGIELGAAASYIVQAVNGMGLAFTDAGRVADVLAQGANASITSVEGLAQALSYAAPSATALGLSLETTVAIIGKFADAGIDASRAGTSLNSILSQFLNPASAFRKELAAAGITTNDFEQALRELAAAGPAGQRAILAVGQEAGPALRGLLSQGVDALDDLKTALENSAGSAATFAEIMQDNLQGASKNFGSVWDSLLIKLGQPALEPLKEQINSLAERLRGFVTDGTAAAFGEAIASAVRNAGQWLQEFLDKVDFQAVGQRLQAFASQVGNAFTRMGEHAAVAGGAIQTLYGALVLGANSVQLIWNGLISALYRVQAAIFETAAGVNQALARISFGDMSENFQQWAAEAEAWAARSADAAETHAYRAVEAAEDTRRGLDNMLEGWDALAGASTRSGDAAVAAAQRTAAALSDVDPHARTAAAGIQHLEQQAAETAVELENLRAQYTQAVSDGNWQRAAEIQQQLQQALQRTGDTATAAVPEVQSLEDAFSNLGVKPKAELDRLADNAKASFDKVLASGTATPREIQDAFQAYAKVAIEANDGVADSSVKAQASQLGLRVETDNTGKSVVKSAAEMKSGFSDIGDGAEKAGDQVGDLKDTTEETGDEAENLGGIVRETGDSMDGAADSAQNLGGAAKWMAEAFERGYERIGRFSEAAEQAARAAAKDANSMAEVAANIGELSKSAAAFVDGGSFSKLSAEVREFEEAARQADDEARKLRDQLETGLGSNMRPFYQALAAMSDFEASLARASAAAARTEIAMSRLDKQIERLGGSGARGLEDLKIRLLELNGTEEQVAQARARREEAELLLAQKKLQIELKKAQIEGDADKISMLREEIRLHGEMAAVLQQVHKAEEQARARERKEQAAEERERRNEQRRQARETAAPASPADQPAATAATAPATAALQVQRVVQINHTVGGRTYPTYAAPGVADEFLRALAAAKEVSA